MNSRKLVIGITPYVDSDDKITQYIPKGYLKGIAHIGGEPLMIRHETPLDDLEDIVKGLDGMLFSGGPDVEPAFYGEVKEPECGSVNLLRDVLELKLLPLCFKYKIPVLGICRGCQLINVSMGGTLTQDVPTRYGKVHQMAKDAPSAFDHDVRILPGTMMYDIMGQDIKVDSYHHQCVKRLADGLIPSAYAPEGFIEGFELPEEGEQFLMAVQWHPEVTLSDDMYSVRIFDRFNRAIRERLQSK